MAVQPKAKEKNGDASPLDNLAEGTLNAKKIEKEMKKRVKKYIRGPAPSIKKIEDKKLKGKLKFSEKLFGEAAVTAAKTEQWLLPSEGGFLEAEGVERTSNYKQEDIVREVGLAAGRQAFDLKLLELGLYSIDFTRNGRFLLLGGRKGHLAMVDWSRSKIVTELQVKETVRDVHFLHSEMFFAAAQKKYVYIYDKRGLEVHCLKEHRQVSRLAFLPHHFLLASVGTPGVLQYVDTSTGQIVARCPTKRGPCRVMEPNPHNAILHLGHTNGTVTLWSPNVTQPLAAVLCHRGPVAGLQVDPTGRYMVTAGLDRQLKVWDLRKFQEVHSYFCPSSPSSLSLSHTGLLAVGHGSGVQVWRDAVAVQQKQKQPYMSYRVPGAGEVEKVAFCPYEDVLGVGHSRGYSSVLIPGAGEPNFDSLVANPFATRQQRREGEVHSLLDKLQPEMIVWDPQSLGSVQREPREVQTEAVKRAEAANRAKERNVEEVERKKQKGRSKAGRKHKKKQQNVIEAKKGIVREDVRKKEREEGKKGEKVAVVEEGALARFLRKSS